MSSVCFYFQVHQPYRLRRFTYFENSPYLDYFDDTRNAQIARKVADKCYLPANETMLKLIHRHSGKFKFALSITGVFLEQMERYAPDVIDSFRRLRDTGCVEFLAETYYHSLASVYDENEFKDQISQHTKIMQHLFGYRPRVFRNTELIYNNRLAKVIKDLGFDGILAEGSDEILQGRSPNSVYHAPGMSTKLLLKNYRLSDDIAFRFSNPNWEGYPLTPEKFAHCLHSTTDTSQVVNLFMDYETFGEHQWATTGIFNFMDELPGIILSNPRWDFATPSEAIARYGSAGEMSFYKTVSWADKDRDLSAWQGNQMQWSALDRIYALNEQIKNTGDPSLLSTWRKLQTSDHYYYMSTKFAEDGEVHSYFSPYESPYNAYINLMNVLKNLQEKLGITDIKTERTSPTVHPVHSSNGKHEPLQPEKSFIPESKTNSHVPFVAGVGNPAASLTK